MADDAADPGNLPWRVGRHLGRTIYARVGDETSDVDEFIGVMDTAELAAEACSAHNYRLAIRTGAPAIHPAT